MRLINNLYLAYSSSIIKELDNMRSAPMMFQHRCFNYLISSGSDSSFGKEHKFSRIDSISAFQKLVPIRDYNSFAPYIERLRMGEEYVLWNQKVKWFAKSSGTSASKSKFIPITKDSLDINHYGGFKQMLASYINGNRDSKMLTSGSLTLGGSVKADYVAEGGESSNRLSGDLSAILLSNSPKVTELIRKPSKRVALLSDFNEKVEQICKECVNKDIVSFSGVPSWNLIMLNRVLEYTGKSSILDVWPNMELFMHGGIGFEPYRELYKKIIPSSSMNYLENYNASEGYFAFKDNLSDSGMLLSLNIGVFYEFIPMAIFDKVVSGEVKEIPTIEDVELGVNYAMVISTVSGLWRYIIGDCVEFVSLSPYKVKITGRTQLFINAFGEELMIGNAEKAIVNACKECCCSISDFTVAPHFMESLENGTTSKGYHIWGIEFIEEPKDILSFERVLDRELTLVNSDYEAKRANSATMERLKVVTFNRGTFYKWMNNRAKVGGQNKVPRLYNNSKFLDELVKVSSLINS